MGRKKKEEPPMPATTPKPPTADRHKKRYAIHVRPRLHRLISELATKHHRHLRNEVELAVLEYLRNNGVEVPPDILGQG